MNKPRFSLETLVTFGLVGSLAIGCGGSSSGGGEGGGGAGGAAPDASMGDPNVLVGSFQVKLVKPVPASNGNPEVPGSTAVLGKIYDGPSPQTIIWEEALKEGACRLEKPRVPFCNTPCGGSAACVENDKCQDYPLAHGAGTITVTGLHTEAGEAGFKMDPVANNYQPPASVKLPFPAFSEGEAISFAAAGEYFSSFTLGTKGIAPLVLSGQTITLESGKAVSLSWTPGQAGLSSIHVKLDISHHGGTKGMIECDTDDTGALDIPASLVTELITLGVAGYPSIIVTRSATGSATIAPGRVDLVVLSTVEQVVEIPGLTSCTSDADCLMGQMCQSDLTCK